MSASPLVNLLTVANRSPHSFCPCGSKQFAFVHKQPLSFIPHAGIRLHFTTQYVFLSSYAAPIVGVVSESREGTMWRGGRPVIYSSSHISSARLWHLLWFCTNLSSKHCKIYKITVSGVKKEEICCNSALFISCSSISFSNFPGCVLRVLTLTTMLEWIWAWTVFQNDLILIFSTRKYISYYAEEAFPSVRKAFILNIWIRPLTSLTKF